MTRLPENTTTFHQELKSRTTQAHDRLEALPISKSILSPAVSLKEYAQYLSLMQPIVADVEKRIFPMLTDVIDDLEIRRKSASIENDLRCLGFQPATTTDAVFNAGSKAFALGIMYVVEGSAIGGRFILKNLEKSLGLSESAGASYFAGYGSTTGSVWKRFVGQMAEFEEKTGTADEIIAGAEYAFSVIEKQLS
jgi:heme oxygenase